MALLMLPEEILRHIFFLATSTTHAPHLNVFDTNHPNQYIRSLGLYTRRNLNQTSHLFRALSWEFLFNDVILKSANAVEEFANLLSHVNEVGWWVQRLKITFPSQWASIHNPTHAKSLARIITLCPRLAVFEDALLTGSGNLSSTVLSALSFRDSLRAIGWTGQAYPSTNDVRILLERLPNLETLHLQGCNPSVNVLRSGLAPTPTSIRAPALKHLTLRLAEMRAADVFPLLVNATTPSLTHLVLVGNVYFGGNIAAKTAALREFFDIHGPNLESLDIRDDECFEPVGPIVELLAKCTNLKEIIYPVSCTSPLCDMEKVECVGLRGVVPDLLSPTHSIDNAQTALRYLDAHLDVLLSGGLPKLKTIQMMDSEVFGGYPELRRLSPHSQIYLTAFGARCAAVGVRVVDGAGTVIHF
ncbi:hypothetical protein RhiJN_01064 [Ceratobasidium sp. AG-Ba]|nr:hypothetical protein RhiJN_01064 [Ceratobasidium sp. AG-Ba]